VLPPHQQALLVRGTEDQEHAMAEALKKSIAVVGIDISKNSFHVVGLDECGAIVLQQKWSRGQGGRQTRARLDESGFSGGTASRVSLTVWPLARARSTIEPVRHCSAHLSRYFRNALAPPSNRVGGRAMT
jgi:hypothetical protein